MAIFDLPSIYLVQAACRSISGCYLYERITFSWLSSIVEKFLLFTIRFEWILNNEQIFADNK